MNLHRILPLALLSLAFAARAQGVPAHSLALINDPRSHGQVGDRLLSLNEAIQLNNQTLSLEQLSPEELAQIRGFGDIAFAEVDATQVPLLTLERDLDVVLDSLHGFIVGGTFGTPVIDINGTRGFVCDSNFVDFRNLVVRGGRCAILVNMTSTLFGSQIETITFDGQTDCAIRIVLATETGDTRMIVRACTFNNLPKAIDILDVGRDRGSLLASEVFLQELQCNGGQIGVDVTLGPGGRSYYLIERSTFTNTAQAVRFRRPAASDSRELLLECVHLIATGGQSGLAVAGHATSRTLLLGHLLDLQPAAGGVALSIGPLGSVVQTQLEDSRLGGRSTLLGGATRQLDLANLRLANATLDLGATGAPVTVEECLLAATTLNAQGSSALALRDCQCQGGAVLGSAPVTMAQCFTSGTTLGTNVTTTNPLPAPMLGSLELSTLAPQIGGPLQLLADLAPGLFGFWILGRTEAQPVLGPRPLHFYWVAGTQLFLASPVRNQDRITIPIPNDVNLVGLDLVAQLGVFPDPGLQAPAIALPPGRRFVIR